MIHRNLAASSAPVTRNRLNRLIDRALPGQIADSFETLPGGMRNLNLLIRFGPSHPAVVLRLYRRDPSACRKEASILRSTAATLPVPELIFADETGDEDIGPWLVYRYAEGMTFQELKKHGCADDMAQASFAIGETLASLQSIGTPALLASEVLSQRPAFDFFDCPVLEQRIGVRDARRTLDCLTAWSLQATDELDRQALVHGDFNNRNTLVNRIGGRWRVTGVLDWELAIAGSPLWDAARFICYEDPLHSRREPHFSNGFRHAGGQLPDDWTEVARILNALSAAQSLNSADLPETFVPELCELVLSAVDRRPRFLN